MGLGASGCSPTVKTLKQDQTRPGSARRSGNALEQQAQRETEIHRSGGHELEQTVRDGEGQGSLACCGPRALRVRHDLVAGQQQLTRSLLTSSEMRALESGVEAGEVPPAGQI